MNRAAVQRLQRPGAHALQGGIVRGVLLFLAGVLAGANVLYFLWAPHEPSPIESAASTPVATVSGTAPRPRVPAAPSRQPAAVRPAATSAPTGDTGASMVIAPPGRSATPPGGADGTVERAPGALLIPVRGVVAAALQDTFTDARAEGRSHEAIDIMAPAGTPVLAVADGTVEKLFTSVAGGLTVYQFEPSGRYAYYYAHLQAYAPGLAEKQALRRGDVIGYVGSTGNADPAAPHLHFAVFELGPERRWWQGTAINPYPLLRGQ